MTNIMANEIQGSRFVVTHFLILVLFSHFNCHAMGDTQGNKSEQMSSVINIGVIRNLSLPFSTMINLCIEMAKSDFYSAHPNYKTRLELKTIDVEDVIDVDLAVLELMEHEEVHGLLESHGLTDQIFVAELGRKAQVPIISLAARSSSSDTENRYYISTSSDEAVQARAVSAIFQGFKWKEAVVLYEDNEFGYRFVSHLSKAFRHVDIGLAQLTAIPVSANETRLSKELQLLKENQTVKVFVVHMNASLGFRLFTIAREIGMMSDGHAWIITDSLSNFLSSMDAHTRDSMEGVVGIRPYVPFSKDLEDFQERWKINSTVLKKNTIAMMDLNVHGLWAYDMVTALALALEKIGPVNTSSLFAETTKRKNLRVSIFGPRLQRELSSTRLKGLSGDFELVDGKLKLSAFEIINIIGSGEKTIGFWTPNRGLIRDLSSSSEAKYSTSINELKNVMWPGDSVKQPKGWSIPPSGILRVGVPCNSGIPKFLNISVIVDPVTKEANATGFVVDIFFAALNLLPSPIDHRFYCFGDMIDTNWSYDDMLQQIPERFDMVVADVTIWAPRTLYVDFSLPYLESGSVLVVRKKGFDMWTFTKPLRWDLWLAIFVSCIFMAIVIWILESRVPYQAREERPGPIYLAPIAALAFQERNIVSNNWSKIVLVCWVFMACVLMQSFTANLSAILTVDQLKFAFSEDYHLGYRGSSFTKKFLLENLNIDESRLNGYSTNEEFHDAMSRGSKKGGIDAIFDEIPYMKLFMNQYESQYKIVGPTYRTNGLGFAFPIGSPLAANFSREILKFIQDSGKREATEEKYFGPRYSSSTLSSQGTSSLTFLDFAGLFIIVGFAAFVAVICSETAVLSVLSDVTRRLVDACLNVMNRVEANRPAADYVEAHGDEQHDEDQGEEQRRQDGDDGENVEQAADNDEIVELAAGDHEADGVQN